MEINQEIFKKYNLGNLTIDLRYESLANGEKYIYFNDAGSYKVFIFINKDDKMCIRTGYLITKPRLHLAYKGIGFRVKFEKSVPYNGECMGMKKIYLQEALKEMGFEFRGSNVYSRKYDLHRNCNEYITEYTKNDFEAIYSKYVIEKCLEYLDNNMETIGLKSEEDLKAQDIFCKIKVINIERDVENQNEKSFDFIRIFIPLCFPYNLDKEARKRVVRKLAKDLCKIAINRLERDVSFKKFNVPINFLKLTKLTYTCQEELELIFELKIQ